MFMTTKNQAFTMIEIMATLAIVIILSILAYPALDRYIIQSKVTDAISSAAEVQTMITNQISNNESVTGSGSSLTTPAKLGRYVATYSVSANGAITITTTPNAGSITVTLTPLYNAAAGQVTWACSVSASSNDDYVPPQCRI